MPLMPDAAPLLLVRKIVPMRTCFSDFVSSDAQAAPPSLYSEVFYANEGWNECR